MKPLISEDRVLAAVERDFGAVTSIFPVAEGEESVVIGATVDEGDLIVRVNRSAADFQKDAYCQRAFASHELPIPEILVIGQVDELAYCVSRRAGGMTLQELPPEELPTAVISVADVLRAIAVAPLPASSGYGRFNEHGIGEHGSWRGFLMAICDPGHYDWASVRAMIGAHWLEGHLRAFEDLSPNCPETRRLVHGDFGSNNVLIERGNVTGVIDWSEAMFGDPLYDVANVFFWRPWLDCMEAQARFFEEENCYEMSPKLKCYQMRIGLSQTYQCARASSSSDLRWAMKRCDQLMRV